MTNPGTPPTPDRTSYLRNIASPDKDTDKDQVPGYGLDRYGSGWDRGERPRSYDQPREAPSRPYQPQRGGGER